MLAAQGLTRRTFLQAAGIILTSTSLLAAKRVVTRLWPGGTTFPGQTVFPLK